MTDTRDNSDPEGWEPRLRAIAPAELPPYRAIYFVDRYVLPDSFRTDGTLAYWSGSLDVQLEGRLRELNRWRGRGFTMAIPALFEFWFTMTDAERWGIVLHEFAHFIEGMADWREAGEPIMAALLTGTEPIIERTQSTASQRPRWHRHDARWIRCALHLHQRAELAGWPAPLNTVRVAGEDYGLSPASQYLAALGSEPHDRRTEPLEDILDSPLPEAFAKLWKADTGSDDA